MQKGCVFWKWSDEYEDYLVEKGILPPLNENLNLQQAGERRKQWEDHRQVGRTESVQANCDAEKMCMLMVHLFDVGKDILAVLKLICAVLVLLFVVQIMRLCVGH
jgi:hypothetical protein